MVTVIGFTRREVADLTGMTYRQIAYLEEQEIVIADRVSVARTALALYSWQQLLQLRAIARLRNHVSLQTVRNVLDFIAEHFNESRLFDKSLIVVDESVYWLEPENIEGLMLQVAGKHQGQFSSAILNLGQEIDGIMEAAKTSKHISLEELKKRANLEAVA